MAKYSEILRSLSAPTFERVFRASNRQAREGYLHRHGIKAPSASRGFRRTGAAQRARIEALHAALAEHEDEEMAEEILRAWLLTQRPMLVAALDHLGIPHENGLTQSDLSRFEKLSGRQVRSLVTVLREAGAEDEAISIYLRFMGVPDVDAALAA